MSLIRYVNGFVSVEVYRCGPPLGVCEWGQSSRVKLTNHVAQCWGGMSSVELVARAAPAFFGIGPIGPLALFANGRGGSAAWSTVAFGVETDCEDSGVPPPSATLRRSGR